AFARAAAQVTAPSSGQSTAFVQVLFFRQFRLSGSPLGWSVTLDGFLAGEMQYIFPVVFPPAASTSVLAKAEIAFAGAMHNPTGIKITYNGMLQRFAFSATNSGVGGALLSDGDYEVAAELDVSADIAAGQGNIIGNFYDGKAGFSVTVDAQPIAGIAFTGGT